jgi:hypothetical protein
MSTEEERNILQDMEKKGFTLEVDVLRSLMERNWNCLPQFPYVDQQTKKIRTIDAIASPYFGAIVDEKPKLILECKTSIKPWVFFTPNALRMVTDVKGNKKQVRNESLVYSKIFMLLSLAKKHSQYESTTNINEIPEGLLDELGKTHFFKNELPFACSCHVAFRSNKEDAIDDFREAVCQTNGAYQ